MSSELNNNQSNTTIDDTLDKELILDDELIQKISQIKKINKYMSTELLYLIGRKNAYQRGEINRRGEEINK